MKRRKAIKNLGVSMGLVVATPTVFALLQSCKTDINDLSSWKAIFFEKDELTIVQKLVDVILPKTDNMAGALELNIPKFLDQYMSTVFDQEKQTKTKKELQALITVLQVSEDTSASSSSTEKYDALLTKYLRATKDEKEKYKNNDADKLILDGLENIRHWSTWAFKTSEEIGKNVLVYDAIPGEYIGCVSLEETTGGKIWSL